MRSSASYLRSLDPGLSRAVWILQFGGFGNAFGNGMVSAYLLIYLHNVRGISLGTAGLCLATMGAAALAAGLRLGPLGAGLAFALAAVSFQLGYSAGRAGGGFLLAASPLGLWLVGALALERIPQEIRRTPRRVPLVEAAA